MDGTRDGNQIHGCESRVSLIEFSQSEPVLLLFCSVNTAEDDFDYILVSVKSRTVVCAEKKNQNKSHQIAGIKDLARGSEELKKMKSEEKKRKKGQRKRGKHRTTCQGWGYHQKQDGRLQDLCRQHVVV